MPIHQTPEFNFSQLLLKWFDQHGRQFLPWQRNRDRYGIWVAEIMLQQTQVETVIPYYQKFMARFANIIALANAKQDEVMAIWAGLGYYARARNLHRAAQHIRDHYDGEFPRTLQQVMALPGIGRSTAGAILAFSQNARHPILDGNVKRVLSRYFAIDGQPSLKAVENKLWLLAEQLTPQQRVADYTQAIMDLGATLCTRRSPQCAHCPIRADCLAWQQGRQAFYPTPKPKVHRPRRYAKMILLGNANAEYLLIKRPPSGIWGGLWALPELPDSATADSETADSETVCQAWCRQQFGIAVTAGKPLKKSRHSFTHFELEIQPIACTVKRVAATDKIMDTTDYIWYNPLSDSSVGIPAAVRKIFRHQQKSTITQKQSHNSNHTKAITQKQSQEQANEKTTMSRMIICAKLGKEMSGLEFPTWSGALGQRIFDEISQQAWQDWLRQQTILINEYKLNPLDREHKKYLASQMEAYLFGDGIILPDAWEAQEK